MSGRTPYLRLERRIASAEGGTIIDRWQYGRALLAARAGRKQLPHGMLADLIKAAERANLRLSEQEIQRRIRLAEAYSTEAKVRHAVTDFGSWRELVAAGFPPVDEPATPEDFEALGVPAPSDAATSGQLALTIPGLPEILKTRNGGAVRLADATVADAIAYRDQFREMHESFGKTLAVVEASVAALVEACAGDESMSVAKAWLGDDEDPADLTP